MVTKWRNVVKIINFDYIYTFNSADFLENMYTFVHQYFNNKNDKDTYFKYLGFQWKVAMEIAMSKLP